jgi:hypothetical protein
MTTNILIIAALVIALLALYELEQRIGRGK